MALGLYANGRIQFLDNSGNPLAGGLLFMYETDGSTPKTTWHDQGQAVAHAHPIVLDANGRPPEEIWLTGTYTASLSPAGDTGNGSPIWTAQNQTGINALAVEIVTDLTPQLGANLDANGFNIQFDDNTGILDDSGNEQLIFQKTASAVNHFEMTNAATGVSPTLGAAGDNAVVSLVVAPKGTDSALELPDGKDQIIRVQPESSGAGSQLTIHSGNAEAAGTDIGGGDLNLASGTSEGTGTGSVNIQTAKAGSSGSVTNEVATRVTIGGQHVELSPHGTSGGNTLEMRFLELAANGVHYTGFKSADALAGNVIWTLPDADATTTNQVLSSDASGVLSWEDNGGIVLLSSATASASSSIDFTSNIDTTYDHYMIIIDKAVATATDRILYMRTDSDGGASFDSSAGDYNYSGLSINSIGTVAGFGSASATQMQLSGVATNGSDADASGSYVIHLYQPASGSSFTHITFQGSQLNDTGSQDYVCGGGNRESATAIDAVQFLFNTGNIATGEFKLYGVRK